MVVLCFYVAQYFYDMSTASINLGNGSEQYLFPLVESEVRLVGGLLGFLQDQAWKGEVAVSSSYGVTACGTRVIFRSTYSVHVVYFCSLLN